MADPSGPSGLRAVARLCHNPRRTMRIVIVGGGEVGYALCRALAPDHDLAVIDSAPQVAERFSHLDVQFIIGSGTDGAVLQRAGIAQAQLLVACTGFDEVNVITCAVARRFGSMRTICFVSREDFLEPFGELEALRAHLGIDRVLWPEAQLAADIERIIEAPGSIDAESFAEGQVRLLEYRLSPTSFLVQDTLAQVDMPPGSLAVAFKRGDTFAIPRGNTRLAPGDKVIIMGTLAAMQTVQARVAVEAAAPLGTQRVTIVGAGDVGGRLAERLDRRPTIDLRVIERDARRGEQLAASLHRALVLHGDGTDLELLEAEDIGRSDVLVSVIDNDEKNLFASLLGRQLGVKKVITRVSKPSNLRLFERVGIDVALSVRGAAVAAVVHEVKGGPSALLAVLEEGQGEVLEVVVPDHYPPTTLKDLDMPIESIVGAIRRGREVIVPSGRDLIRAGDRLLVFASTVAADKVRTLFLPKRS